MCLILTAWDTIHRGYFEASLNGPCLLHPLTHGLSVSSMCPMVFLVYNVSYICPIHSALSAAVLGFNYHLLLQACGSISDSIITIPSNRISGCYFCHILLPLLSLHNLSYRKGCHHCNGDD